MKVYLKIVLLCLHVWLLGGGVFALTGTGTHPSTPGDHGKSAHLTDIPTLGECSECPPRVVLPDIIKKCFDETSGQPLHTWPCGGIDAMLDMPGLTAPPPGGFGGGNPPATPTCGLCICFVFYPEPEPAMSVVQTYTWAFSLDDPTAGLNCLSGPGCQAFEIPCDSNSDGIADVDQGIDPVGSGGTGPMDDFDMDGIPNSLDVDKPKLDEDGEPVLDAMGNVVLELNMGAALPPDDPAAMEAYLIQEGHDFAEGGTFSLADVVSAFAPNGQYDKNMDGNVTLGDVVQIVQDGFKSTLNSTESVTNLLKLGGNPLDLAQAVADFMGFLGGVGNVMKNIVKDLDPDNFKGGQNEKNKLLESISGIIDQALNTQETLEEGLLVLNFFHDQVQKFAEAGLTAQLDQGLEIYGKLLDNFFSAIFPDADGSLYQVEIVGPDGTVLGTWVPQSSPDHTGDPDLVGDPVNTWNGEFHHSKVDLQVPGRGIDLKIERHYRSRQLRQGILGPNWSATPLETHIRIMPGQGMQLLELFWGNGDTSYFVLDSTPGATNYGELRYEGVLGEFGVIRLAGPDAGLEPGCARPMEGFVLRRPDGTLYYFCPPTYYVGGGGILVSWLRKISDPYGNALVLQRDALGQVTKIIDTLRREYTLSYDIRHGLLTHISGPAGIEIDYHFDLANYATGLVVGSVGSTGTPTHGGGTGTTGTLGTTGSTGSGVVGTLTPGGTGVPISEINPFGPELFKRELLKVDYPTTSYLDASGTVTAGRPFESYTYHEHPEGFKNQPEPVLNHNLHSISVGGQGPSVVVEYETDPADYGYDRVKHYTVDGFQTDFKFEKQSGNPALDDPYFMQPIFHVAWVRSAGGELKSFHHGKNGELLRYQDWTSLDGNGDFSADGPVPGEPDCWATVLAYDDKDFLVIRRETGSNWDFLPAQKRTRTTLFTFDNNHPDRLQQSNLREITRLPSSQGNGEPAQMKTSMTYDPVTGRANSVIDPLGRKTDRIYGHQELGTIQVSQLFGVAGWGIVLDPLQLNKPDLNGDGPGGTFELVALVQPDIVLASPMGPGPGQNCGSTTQACAEVFQYNAFGQQTGHRTAGGVWILTQFNKGLPVAEILDPGGLDTRTNFEFDELGRPVKITAADGGIATTEYDGRGNALEIRKKPPQGTVAPRDIVHQFFFDFSGRLVGEGRPFYAQPRQDTYFQGLQPALENRASYSDAGQLVGIQVNTHDENGALIDQYDLTIDYDGRGRESRISLPGGAYIGKFYDPRDLLIRTERSLNSDGDLGVFGRAYNHYGELAARIGSVSSDGGAQPDSIHFDYDGYGRNIATSGPGDQLVVKSYDQGDRQIGEQVWVAGLKKADETYSYDLWDRQTQKSVANLDALGQPQTPAQLVTRFGFGAEREALLWTTTGDPSNPTQQILTRNTYDAAGRRTSSFLGSPDEVGTIEQFDAVGRVLSRRIRHRQTGVPSAVNPDESLWQFEYDPLGRLKRRIDPEGGVTTHEYGAAGELIEQEDPLGNQIHQTFDSKNQVRVIREIGHDGLDRSRHFIFDPQGRLTEIRDGLNQPTWFQHDPLGRLSAKYFADGSYELYSYDLADRLTEVSRLAGYLQPIAILETRAYDGRNRMTSLTAVSSNQVLAPQVTRSYIYDFRDRPIEVRDQVGSGPQVTIKRDFTSAGLLLRERMEGLNLSGFTPPDFGLDYDNAGFLTDLHYASGLHIQRDRDAIGRLSQITRTTSAGNALIADFGGLYGLRGFLDATLAGNGRWERDYDGAGRVLRDESLAGPQTLLGRSYQYDDAGQLEQRDHINNGTVTETETFAYDGFKRLNQWRYGVQAGQPAVRERIWEILDEADNSVKITDSFGGVTQPDLQPDLSNSLNQYESFGLQTPNLAYDLAGQEFGRATAGGSIIWIWDALGRPAQAILNQGSPQERHINWRYDGFDHMVMRDDGQEIAVYGRLLGRLCQIQRSSGIQEFAYGYGDQPFWRLRNQAGIVDEAAYLQIDPFQNAIGMHDGAQVMESYELTPFGSLWDPTQPGVRITPADFSYGNELFFQAAPLDPLTDTIRLGVRHYDPRLGRFISRDPLGESASLNLYGYARSNPFFYHDASGYAPDEVHTADDKMPDLSGISGDDKPAKFVDPLYGTTYAELDKFVASVKDSLGLSADNFDDLSIKEKLTVLDDAIQGTTQMILDGHFFYTNQELAAGIDWLQDLQVNFIVSLEMKNLFKGLAVDSLVAGAVVTAGYLAIPLIEAGAVAAAGWVNTNVAVIGSTNLTRLVPLADKLLKPQAIWNPAVQVAWEQGVVNGAKLVLQLPGGPTTLHEILTFQAAGLTVVNVEQAAVAVWSAVVAGNVLF